MVTPGGGHRAPEPEWVALLAGGLGVLLVTSMLAVSLWAAVLGEWLLFTFAATMVGLTCWDSWMRWRAR